MKHEALIAPEDEEALDLRRIMERVAACSPRPRYTFMVLDLIARVATDTGRAGPLVREREHLVPIREWLCTAIAPTAARHHRRLAMIDQVRASLAHAGDAPSDAQEIERLVEQEVRDRILASGMTSVSRAVSELVRAGLLERHYQGYHVDHENRGAQRHAVYVVPPAIRAALQGDVPRLI